MGIYRYVRILYIQLIILYVEDTNKIMEKTHYGKCIVGKIIAYVKQNNR
jgi:hypothetical protein